jgi:hypothetical protein
VKIVFFVFVGLLLSGCGFFQETVTRDFSIDSQAMAEQRARVDLSCRNPKADRPIRRDSMTNWQYEIYSEYKVWVEGCNKQITYLVVCREDEPCRFADQIDIDP